MYMYIQNNQSLKVLNLAYNGLANEGAVEIANALKMNSTLQELDIRWAMSPKQFHPSLVQIAATLDVVDASDVSVYHWYWFWI